MSDDRLALLLRAPALVEEAVRATLQAALDARRAYGRAIDARDFANEALARLERGVGTDDVRLDAVGRHELAAATLNAATRFVSSRLARRLFSVDPRRLCNAPAGADAALRDAGGRLHFIRLESFINDAPRAALARQLAARPQTAAVQLPLVHFFSLRSARFRSFTIPVRAEHLNAPPTRNAA